VRPIPDKYKFEKASMVHGKRRAREYAGDIGIVVSDDAVADRIYVKFFCNQTVHPIKRWYVEPLKLA
jgi:hypothetical protein